MTDDAILCLDEVEEGMTHAILHLEKEFALEKQTQLC